VNEPRGYFIRCEVGDDPFHEVSRETYLWYEERYRWSARRESADGSRFSGMGVEVDRRLKASLSEQDVIIGNH
jgi:hypothetical protein